MSRYGAMIQIRPYVGGAATRPFGRAAWRPLNRFLPSFSLEFDWRRTLRLQQRLLSGDLGVIREVSQNESDNVPSLAALLLGVLASGLGAWLWMLIDSGSIASPALRVLLFGSLASIAVWGLWLAVSHYALGSIFKISVPLGTLMRPMALAGGFAVWQFFMLVGPASFAVGLIVMIASVMLTVLAVRAAAPEADDRAAIISVGIGFGVYALVLSLVADLLGVGSGLFVHAIG